MVEMTVALMAAYLVERLAASKVAWKVELKAAWKVVM
jgi:hypothetical protein